jgi:hypothetical protein
MPFNDQSHEVSAHGMDMGLVESPVVWALVSRDLLLLTPMRLPVWSRQKLQALAVHARLFHLCGKRRET